MRKHTRRSLLEVGWRSVGLAAALSLGKASGQDGGTKRKVLVSVMLLGGNDSNNLVVPLDASGYNAYASARGELALPAGSLLPIRSSRFDNTFGLPTEAAELSALYAQGALAIVANTGDMSRPVTKATYMNAREAIAPDAFSHDAVSKMQFLPDGFAVPSWWSGLLKQNAQEFENQAFRFSNGMTAASLSGSWIGGPRLDNPDLTNAMSAVAVQTAFPNTGIGRELLRAVQLAQAGANLGLGSQLITCVMGGWDTHNWELQRNAKLYADLSQALAAFYQATVELGIASDVAAFTWSEFNRTMAPNEMHGTQHGWAGHQLVIGGGVRGGEIYGTFPSLELGGADDVAGNGSWIPTTSTIQFAATLAKWFGLTAGEQMSALPDLRYFAATDLGLFGSTGGDQARSAGSGRRSNW